MKRIFVIGLIVLPLAILACKESGPSTKIDPDELTRLITWRGDGKDIDGEMQTFYRDVRLRYNQSQFDELEIIADKIRSEELKFSNSEYKIEHFYKTFTCRDDEPENMWELHDRIHREWIAKFPESITAKVAHARFKMEHAWHARGGAYIDKVKKEDMELFQKRLAEADVVLVGCVKQRAECHMWSLTKMKVALGQQIELAEFDKIFRAAKADEPQFFPYDTLRAYYLLPRWYGKEGQWEKAALDEIFLPDGGGTETYAKVVMEQKRFYDNIFEETNADWDKTKDGWDKILLSEPSSRSLLNGYCFMACIARDAAKAMELFEKIGDTPDYSKWRVGKINVFEDAKQWASAAQQN